MSRIFGVSSAVALSALLSLAGCSPARSNPTTTPAPVQEPEDLGERPEVFEQPVIKPRRDILGATRYDLPVEANSWVEAELDYLVNERSAVIGRWIERGSPYQGFIKRELKTAGVPTDLYHLAMIESGMLPTARSRAGAVGFWQFMPTTGRQMGLRVDDVVDERMDPVRSTRAAARHLRSLHGIYKDWALAAAAYNAGSGRVSRSMQKFGARDFWALAEQGDLAQETRQYVPRLYAMTVIGRDPSRFGLPTPAGGGSFAYDSIHVDYATPLEELSKISDVPREQLQKLNPHLVQGTTPSGYWVWVPSGKGVAMQRAYLASDFRKFQGLGTYTVRNGDNLGLLASLSGVAATRIRELNPGVEFEPLQIGETLKLPFEVAQQLAARSEEKAEKIRVAANPEKKASESREKADPKEKSDAGKKSGSKAGADAKEKKDPSDRDSRVREASNDRKSAASDDGDEGAQVHEVKGGETLWVIARRYDVPVERLQKLNDLSGSMIRPGQKLRIPVAVAAAKTAREEERREHVVEDGETLWGIARKYDTSVEAIKEANQLGERPIVPAQKLLIPRR